MSESMRARSVPETVQTNDSLANCRERKQTTRIHVNQTRPANSCILWKATGNLGSKRSRVQIPAARPKPFKDLRILLSLLAWLGVQPESILRELPTHRATPNYIRGATPLSRTSLLPERPTNPTIGAYDAHFIGLVVVGSLKFPDKKPDKCQTRNPTNRSGLLLHKSLSRLSAPTLLAAIRI